MISIVESNEKFGYKLYSSDYIIKQQKALVLDSRVAHNLYLKYFSKFKESSTKGYYMYNIFLLTSPSIYYFNLFKDLDFAIKDFLKDKNLKHAWFQSWINFHKSDQLAELNWHTHSAKYHGYICIEPKITTTEFKNYAIKNSVGQIYIGPTGQEYKHRVNIDEPYSGHRITVAFDILTDPLDITTDDNNLSFIPINI